MLKTRRRTEHDSRGLPGPGAMRASAVGGTSAVRMVSVLATLAAFAGAVVSPAAAAGWRVRESPATSAAVALDWNATAVDAVRNATVVDPPRHPAAAHLPDRRASVHVVRAGRGVRRGDDGLAPL